MTMHQAASAASVTPPPAALLGQQLRDDIRELETHVNMVGNWLGYLSGSTDGAEEAAVSVGVLAVSVLQARLVVMERLADQMLAAWD